jgi:hypothetical protein
MFNSPHPIKTKPNEITALARLLDMIDIAGGIVAADRGPLKNID